MILENSGGGQQNGPLPEKTTLWLEHLKGFEWQPISAKMNTGIEDLKQNIHLHCGSGIEHQTEEVWLTNLRQQEAGERGTCSTETSLTGMKEYEGEELVAVDLRSTQCFWRNRRRNHF